MLKKWRIFVASAACVALLFVYGIVQAVEIGEQYERRQARLQEISARLEQLQAIQAQHPDLEGYEMETASQRKHVDGLLPDQMAGASLLPKLQQNALKYGLELRELLPGEAAQEQGMRMQPLQVKVAGDYFGLLDFVKSLEGGTPFCRVADMELRQEEGVLTAKLQVKAYSL